MDQCILLLLSSTPSFLVFLLSLPLFLSFSLTFFYHLSLFSLPHRRFFFVSNTLFSPSPRKVYTITSSFLSSLSFRKFFLLFSPSHFTRFSSTSHSIQLMSVPSFFFPSLILYSLPYQRRKQETLSSSESGKEERDEGERKREDEWTDFLETKEDDLFPSLALIQNAASTWSALSLSLFLSLSLPPFSIQSSFGSACITITRTKSPFCLPPHSSFSLHSLLHHSVSPSLSLPLFLILSSFPSFFPSSFFLALFYPFFLHPKSLQKRSMSVKITAHKSLCKREGERKDERERREK